MAHLANALILLQNQLQNNWISQFGNTVNNDDIDDPLVVADAELQTAAILDQTITPLFELFNNCLIAGEYVSDLVNYKTIVEAIDDYVNNVVANIDIPGFPRVTNVCQEIFRTDYHNPIRRSLTLFKILLDFVKRHLQYQPNIVYQKFNSNIDKDRNLDSTAEQMASLFQINARLALIDHNLTFQDSTFTKLLDIQNSITTYTILPDIKAILEKKCAFLLYKVSFRLKQSQKDYLYSIDFNYTAVQLTEVPGFEDYTDIIKGHYDTGMYSDQFKLRCSNAVSKFERNPSLLDLNDYHALIKYFKDQKGDQSKLKKLKDHYTTFYISLASTVSLYDRKAYDIVFCYLINNILSIELEKKKINLQNWEDELRECTDKAESFHNKNFFPYYKIIKEFLEEEIWAQFSKEDYNFLIISQLIENYETNLTKLVEHIGICEETAYLPFQNNYANCLVPINIGTNTQNCFISSSFAVPLNFKEYKEELEIFKANLTQFKTTLRVQKLMDADRKDIKNVKLEIERTDKRHIEILSIFAALVMFVSNEIQIFSKIPNMGDAVAYTLFFAFGLGLFVLMIWFITRPDGLKLSVLTPMHKFVIGFFCVGLSAAILYVYTSRFRKNDHQKQIEHMDFVIDSLRRIKSIDTLSGHINSAIKDAPIKKKVGFH